MSDAAVAQKAKSERDHEIPDPQAPVDPDASIGELIGRIVEDGRQLVGAEISLMREKARVEVGFYKSSAIFFGAAAVFAIAALVAFAVGVTMALATLIGPLLGGLVSTLLFLGVAALLGKMGLKRLEQA
ncbi:phage holin family protein [Sphingomicrobium sp. XHP0235]|uniref:phage holin family protein n=1 Tax=Sphingomicrobium aquimarinum TaxID=3133971 RepID=UPI0031FEBE1C